MPMLEIMPADEIWTILASYTCPQCWRHLQNHTPSDRQTCHDALTIVTLLRKSVGHNPLRDAEQKNSTCHRFNPKKQTERGG